MLCRRRPRDFAGSLISSRHLSAALLLLLFTALTASAQNSTTQVITERPGQTPQIPGEAPQPAAVPDSVKWVRNSVEYAAICTEVYRMGLAAVERAARRQKKGWAVVLDLDETVLDNSLYQLEHPKFTSDTWDAWVNSHRAGLVPGAKDFLGSVRRLAGAHIVFISDRRADQAQVTIQNLEELGVFGKNDLLLNKADKQDTKLARRQCVESGTGRCQAAGPLTIVATFGDSLRDHRECYGAAASQLRSVAAQDQAWGTRQFVLPNPMYGQWQQDYKGDFPDGCRQ